MLASSHVICALKEITGILSVAASNAHHQRVDAWSTMMTRNTPYSDVTIHTDALSNRATLPMLCLVLFVTLLHSNGNATSFWRNRTPTYTPLILILSCVCAQPMRRHTT